MSEKEEAALPLQSLQPVLTQYHGAGVTDISTERASRMLRILQYNYLLIPLTFALVHKCTSISFLAPVVCSRI